MTAGRYRPTDVCDAGIADKLGIPAAYLRKTRDSHPALFDANVNGWLERDDRRFFIRALRGSDGETGVARAWLSDGYKKIDHLDTLMAVFDGIRRSGQHVTIDSCDLTERRMYVRVRCEAVQVLAPALLSGYRSPFTGAHRRGQPGRVRRVRHRELRDRLRRLHRHPAADRAGVLQRDDHHPRRGPRGPPRRTDGRGNPVVRRYPGPAARRGRREGPRRGAGVLLPRLRRAHRPGPGKAGRAPGRRRAQDHRGDLGPAALHRGAAVRRSSTTSSRAAT